MIGLGRVFRYELRRQGRRRSYLAITLGLPIVAIALFYGLQLINKLSPSSSPSSVPSSLIHTNIPTKSDNSLFGSESLPTGLVDQSDLISSTHTATGVFKPYPTVEAATTALNSQIISGYYLIPADYLTNGTVSLWRLSFNNLLGGPSEKDLTAILKNALAAKTGITDRQVLSRLSDSGVTVNNHKLSADNQVKAAAGFDLSFALVYVFALALVMGTFMTSGYLMQAVMEERQNRIVELLMSSIRPSELLIGKVLALGILGLFQIVLWGATAYFLIKQAIPLNPAAFGLDVTVGQLLLLVAFFIVGYLMFGGFYAIVGVLSNSMREGPQMATFITLPAMLPLYLTTVFAGQPDGSLATVLSLFPLTAPLGMVMRIAVTSVPGWQIALSLILVFLTGVGCLWAASKLFRIVTLLSGQLPTIRDIPKLLRQSSV